MADIDIGSEAINRNNHVTGLVTMVNRANPANNSGKITSVEIWAKTELSNCEVATFFVVSGNFLSTRDTHSIGTVFASSKQTFSGLDITVEAGDYIGIKYDNVGQLKVGTNGSGMWHISEDKIPCTNEEFTLASTWVGSLYGTGELKKGCSKILIG